MNIENFVNETETANMALENTHYGAAAIEEMLSGGPKKIFFCRNRRNQHVFPGTGIPTSRAHRQRI